MREIKFRGKRIDNGEWIYGDLWQCKYSDGRIKITISEQTPNALCNIEVIAETVGQYTGLKDKYGKEIYEGDIVKAEESKIVCEVIYTEGAMFMLRWNDTKWGNQEYHHYGLGAFTLEVIGNIYEDKHLLEG